MYKKKSFAWTPKYNLFKAQTANVILGSSIELKLTILQNQTTSDDDSAKLFTQQPVPDSILSNISCQLVYPTSAIFSSYLPVNTPNVSTRALIPITHSDPDFSDYQLDCAEQ